MLVNFVRDQQTDEQTNKLNGSNSCLEMSWNIIFDSQNVEFPDFDRF